MSNNPGGYNVFLAVDDSQIKRQIAEFQKLFSNAQKQMQQAIPPQARQQAQQVGAQMNAANSQMQMLQKQSSTFERMREGINSISKSSLALVGIGAGIAGIFKLMMDSSPILSSTFRLLQSSVTLFLRPIGDFIGLLLRPIIIEFYKNVVIPYYQYAAPMIRAIGESGGKAIAAFFQDPLGSLGGLGVNILNWPGQDNKDGKSGPSTTPGGGGSPGDEAAKELKRALEDTVKIKDSTGFMNLLFNRSADDIERSRAVVADMRRDLQASRRRTEEINQINERMKNLNDLFMGRTESTVQRSGQSAEVVRVQTASINEQMKQAGQDISSASNSVLTIKEAMEQARVTMNPFAPNAHSINSSMKSAADSVEKAKGSVDDASIGMAAAFAGAAAAATQAWEVARTAVSKISAFAGTIPNITVPGQQHFGIPQAFAQPPPSRGSSVGSGSKTINLSGASQGSKSLARALFGGSTRYNVKFQKGGTILEPSAIIGLKSGGMGLMAEKGPEHIVPQRDFSPRSIKIEVNIPQIIVHKDANVEGAFKHMKSELTKAVIDALHRSHSRGGII